MKIITFFLIKIPYKITLILFYKLEYLYYRYLYLKPKLKINCSHSRYLLCGEDDFKNIADNYRNLFPDNVKEKIAHADLICEHVFDLLGSGPKKLSPEGNGYQFIDWNSDFKSGYRWDPKVFFRYIRYGHVRDVEIKVPWELSRFQHLNILGQTYLLTNDMKYLEEFVAQITDWIDNNPVGFGVNWYYAMDVAIRAANWLVASEYFSKEDNLPKDFSYKFYSSIYEHAKFIRSHLERSKINSNHYIANISGLFFIAIYCPFFKESRKWLDFCKKELINEIQQQVYEDGCDFEASTSYHRLVIEMLFYCSLLADRVGMSFPKSYTDRLKKMFEVSLHCIKPNGMIPQIGDNDSGRFLIFTKRPILEHKYLLTFASIYYKNSSFKIPNFNFDEEAFWVFGIRGKKLYDELPFTRKPLTSRAFPDAGWYIIRHKNDYCIISCGPNGQNGKGGHAHNDKLSFELALDGHDIIVDPGTYVYTANPEERNKFRSTEYHNTIQFGGSEQNMIPNKLFILPEMFKIVKSELSLSDEEIKFQGEIHYGNIEHQRIITLDKRSANWQIKDSVSCLHDMNTRMLFHLSPHLTNEGDSILIKRDKNKIASLDVEGYNVKRSEYDYSPEYGIKIKSECLFVDIIATNDITTVNTYIYKR